jgi:hypothetical protein
MLPGAPREAGRVRRSRVACPACDETIEFTRLREHLRNAHQMGSAQLETAILTARKEAIRMNRAQRH